MGKASSLRARHDGVFQLPTFSRRRYKHPNGCLMCLHTRFRSASAQRNPCEAAIHSAGFHRAAWALAASRTVDVRGTKFLLGWTGCSLPSSVRALFALCKFCRDARRGVPRARGRQLHELAPTGHWVGLRWRRVDPTATEAKVRQ